MTDSAKDDIQRAAHSAGKVNSEINLLDIVVASLNRGDDNLLPDTYLHFINKNKR